MWPVDRPIDYAKNARKWGQTAVEKVAKSLKEFGFRQPIVVDEAGVIVIGHLRRAAARHAGFTEVPVHVASDLSDTQTRALRLADNRSHEEAEWEVGRVCCCTELEPKYVDVIVQRWQNFTGRQATLEGDGRTFEDIAAERLV